MRNAKIQAFDKLGPTADEICRQVDRILTSVEFQAPKRGRNFLEFVVKETLAGRSDFLKAFTIANVVFGREASFDPQNDPVVRIEAGRIRKALERYYLVAGQADDVIITVPKGGYVPHFEYAQCSSIPAVPMAGSQEPPPANFGEPLQGETRDETRRAIPDTWIYMAAVLILFIIAFALSAPKILSVASPPPAGSKPKVIVELFAENDPAGAGSDIARGLRDDVIGQLALFDDIIVVADPMRSARTANADYALQSSVQLDRSRLRTAARLVRQSDGAVIWADNFDADLQSQNKLAIQGSIARQITSAITRPHGAIFQPDEQSTARPRRQDDTCTLAYYSYRQNMTVQSQAAAHQCLQQATQNVPDNAEAWALLSLVYLDELRFRYKLGTSSPARSLEQATAAIRRATSLSPGNPRVLQALMMVSFYRGDIDEALKAGTAAYAANPLDVEVAGEYGFRLAMSGKWQSGCELLSIALNKGVGTRGYYEIGMALCAFMKGDVEEAEQWARRSDLDSNPMHHLVLLSILGAAGKLDEAGREEAWLNSHAPSLMANIREELALRLQRPEDQERFLSGLHAGGLPFERLSAK
jgi:TolB-like protein